MKGRRFTGNRLNFIGRNGIALDTNIENSVMRQSFHFHRVLDNVVRGGVAIRQRKSFPVLKNGHNLEINCRRKAAVQADFFPAEELALCERRVIQKRQAQRFFDLVDIRPGKKNIGDMSLAQIYLSRAVRIEFTRDRAAINGGSSSFTADSLEARGCAVKGLFPMRRTCLCKLTRSNRSSACPFVTQKRLQARNSIATTGAWDSMRL